MTDIEAEVDLKDKLPDCIVVFSIFEFLLIKIGALVVKDDVWRFINGEFCILVRIFVVSDSRYVLEEIFMLACVKFCSWCEERGCSPGSGGSVASP